MNFSTRTTADLVAIFNVIAKPVARFADRKTAEKRLAAALQEPGAIAKIIANGVCPHCGDRHNGLTQGHVQKNGDETHMHLMMCHVCNTEFHIETGKPVNSAKLSTSAAAAISESWKDPAVRADRLTRTAVRVIGKDGQGEFKSVAKAFRALHLPMGVHIKTRMALKAQRRIEFAGYVFEAIDV